MLARITTAEAIESAFLLTKVTRKRRYGGILPEMQLRAPSTIKKHVVGFSYHGGFLCCRFLASTRIGEKGQITVPKQFRDDLKLGVGASFAVLRLGDGLVLIPQQERFEQLCQQISSRLVNTPKKMLSTLADARKRVYERHYGKQSTSKK